MSCSSRKCLFISLEKKKRKRYREPTVLYLLVCNCQHCLIEPIICVNDQLCLDETHPQDLQKKVMSFKISEVVSI